MDQQSIGSIILCQDQETQHLGEEKTNVTEEDNLAKKESTTNNLVKKDSTTDHQSRGSTIEYLNQETQHIGEKKSNVMEGDNLVKKDSTTDHQSRGSTIEYLNQETQHIGEKKSNVTEENNLVKKDSTADHQSRGSTIEYQDQETQHIEEESTGITEDVSDKTDHQSKINLKDSLDKEIKQKVENKNDMEGHHSKDPDTHKQLKAEDKNNMIVQNFDKQCTDQNIIARQVQITQHKEEVVTNTNAEANLKKLQNYAVQQSKSNPIPCQDQETQHVREGQEPIKESSSRLEMLKEIAIKSIDLNVATCSTAQSLQTSLVSKNSYVISTQPEKYKEYDPMLPVIVINSPTNRSPITIQPSRTFLAIESSISPKSLITVLPNQPQSLFLQALAKLNQSSMSLAILNKSWKSERTGTENPDGTTLRSPELTPPDSLTSAPPSYSFVLRQSAARRRPRLMGTFIPSPSFVTKTPPPNYAAAFDIYVDSPLPPQPTRIYHFGFSAMPIICPECGYVGLTAITTKITLCTHLCALLLCLFCCWVCAPLPYVMSSCKDVYHYCRNCRNFLGMYSPSNPETPYPV